MRVRNWLRTNYIFLAIAILPACALAAEEAPKAKVQSQPQIKSLKRLDSTIKRFGGYGDNWHMSWADDDKVYVSLCDGDGLPGTPRAIDKTRPFKNDGNDPNPEYEYNSRMYAINGDMPNVKFEFLPGYPQLLNEIGHDASHVSRYYNFGTLALDGRLYQFLNTPNHHFGVKNSLARFVGAKLIYSPDNGKTWRNQDGTSPVQWEKWEDRTKENMAFFEEPDDAFGLITVLQMGKNYSENKDGYVYIYAPNGSVEGKMNQLALCRVAKDKVLDRAAYEFFVGIDDLSKPRWSKKIADRGVVYTFPKGWVNKNSHPYAWHPSVVYYAASGQYLMANWGMGCNERGGWFGKPSYLGFWTAPQPWGPWKQVYEEKEWTPGGEKVARAYQPQIARKWISADGKTFWLIWTDYQKDKNKQLIHYEFNAQQVEVEFEPAAK